MAAAGHVLTSRQDSVNRSTRLMDVSVDHPNTRSIHCKVQTSTSTMMEQSNGESIVFRLFVRLSY